MNRPFIDPQMIGKIMRDSRAIAELSECEACHEIAFDGTRCSECGSLSEAYLHDKVRRDILGVKTLGDKRSQVWR